MSRFLTLPILLPMLLGVGLLVLQPKSRKVRNRYVMASSLGDVGSVHCLHRADVSVRRQLSGLHPGELQRGVFHLPADRRGGHGVRGIVSVLWPLVTAYALDYMSHEGHENRFFSFWLMAYGVVLGVAYSEDFLSLYFFYEALTLTTLPLVMHAMDEKARYAGRKYLVYSISGAAFAFIGIVFLLNYGVGHLNFHLRRDPGSRAWPRGTAGAGGRLCGGLLRLWREGGGVPLLRLAAGCLRGAHAGVRPAPRGGGGEGRRLRGAAADLLRLRRGLPAGDLGPDRGDDGGHRHHRLWLRQGAADAPSEAAAGLFHGQQSVLHPLCPDADDAGGDAWAA